MTDFEIAGRKIGDGHPTFVVAEMAWAHDGSLDKGLVIVDGAADGAADAINIHVTSVADYMAPHYGAGPGRVSAGRETADMFKYHEDLNLEFDDFAALADHARQRGLLLSAMCNDQASLDFATKRLDPDILMIHPSCVGEERFLRAMAAVRKPLVVYVGGLRLGEVEEALTRARAEGNERIILQHGFQSYPTALEDNNLSYIRTLKRLFGLPVSFGDHTDGDDPMAMVTPLLGIAMGADIIEKHMTFDRAAKGEDFEAALGPAEFKMFVATLRQAERTFGDPAWHPLTERELRYRGVVRKRAVAAHAIAAGTPITADAISYKRSDDGLYPEEIAALLGRPAARDLKENEPIDAEAFA